MQNHELTLLLSFAIFMIGIVGFVLKRNILVLLMCIELMLNATNLAFISFSKQLNNLDGQVIVLFIMTIAAAEAAIGLVIVVLLFRSKMNLNVDDFNLLKR